MVKVAAVQAEAVWLNLEASVEKTIKLIEEASRNDADLIAFPELFITGYPFHIWENAADISMNVAYIDNSLEIESDLFESIKSTAKRCQITVVLGFSEKFHGSLYVAQAIINSTGELVLARRKFKPTHVERVIFGDGNADNFHNVANLKLQGTSYNVGCLNCWEHAQPLLTFYGATQYEEIHIGGWPPLFEKTSSPPSLLFSLCVEGAYALASTYAIQNGCYYIFASGLIGDKTVEAFGTLPAHFRKGGGCAAVFGPDGTRITEALESTTEGIVYAEVNRDLSTVTKHFLDTAGHYSRPDMFSLAVHSPNTDIHKK